MKLWVGTSGYSYKEWKGSFYPEDLPSTEMLKYYADRLSSVEINNTFYRFPKESVLESWASQVHDNFRFVLKAGRKITHEKRLKDAGQNVDDLFKAVRVLKSKLGAILFQTPPNLKKDLVRFNNFLAMLPGKRQVAFEFRHESWFDDEVYAILKKHDYALCIADTDERPNPEIPATASYGYLRLRRAEYDVASLLKWKERILSNKWDEAYVYFKHEDGGKGPQFAAGFRNLF